MLGFFNEICSWVFFNETKVSLKKPKICWVILMKQNLEQRNNEISFAQNKALFLFSFAQNKGMTSNFKLKQEI